MGGDRIELPVSENRCIPTGGRLVCAGHWDYFGTYAVWTRHFGKHTLGYKVVPYDHPAPETIPTLRMRP